MQPDRRTNARRTLFRIGELHVGGYPYAIDCLVRDTSDTGALIEVSHTSIIPDNFRLTVANCSMNEHCRVVRRTAHMLAVTFELASPRSASRCVHQRLVPRHEAGTGHGSDCVGDGD